MYLGTSGTPRSRRFLSISSVLVALLVLSASADTAAAQNTGRLTGRIIDAQNGAGLSDVGVQIVGARLGATSALGGRYMITGIPAGTVTIHVRRIGYQPKTITGLMLDSGQTLVQDVSLEPAAAVLATEVVTAAAERGTVIAALDQQRNATGITSGITAEQISRSPDGDAAQSVQRVSGVTVQDGKYVVVRGLGERYTSAALNGARIPSPEPERRIVPLDVFPAGLIQSITTTKTFTPDLPGDFSGAQVNIATREFPGAREVAYSMSAGFNDRVTGRTLPGQPLSGLEWAAIAGSDRNLPGAIAGANFSSASQQDYNMMVASFRNAWSAQSAAGAPSSSFSASIGGNEPVLGHHVGYAGSLTYSYGQEIRAGEMRAVALKEGDGVREIDRFEGETGRHGVLWGGLLNVSTLIGTRARVAFNNTYNRTADFEARRESGTSENHGGMEFRIDRTRFVERSVRSNQLLLEYEPTGTHRFDAALTWSGVSRREPDRSEIVYAVEADPVTGEPLAPAWFSQNNEGAVRTFGNLAEEGVEGAGSYTLRFGGGADHTVKLGVNYRVTTRDSDNRAYSIFGSLDRDARELSPEEIFDGRFSGSSETVFRVTPLGTGGSYEVQDRLAAVYAMTEYQLASRVRVVGGARLERNVLTLDAESTLGDTVRLQPEYTDLLPAIAVNISLTPDQNLRLSASRTLSRPEYREIAPVQYREVIGGEIVHGNPELRRALIQNYDLRWEWYPAPDEVISVALFAKRFADPVERLYLGTSGSRIVTFANASGAANYGVELEARRNLGVLLGRRGEPFTLFSNATVMSSEIRLGTGQQEDRAMVGQAPYVINIGMSYASGSGATSATLLYNTVGERIYSATEPGLPHVMERPRDNLDLSLRFPLPGAISGKLDARNMLDSPYHIVQGGVTRELYRTGRIVSLGITWSN